MLQVRMEENELHLCHLILFYFRKGRNAVQIVKRICAVHGDGAVADSTAHK